MRTVNGAATLHTPCCTAWASDGTTHGVAAAMFAFAKERIDHLRIDTHQDNLPMQGAIAKAGFERAGIVYVSDGTPRVAFDWLREA